MIGIFGSLIKQPSNPFANLTKQAKKVAEINSIITMYPSFEQVAKDPCGSIDIGDGYLLLGPKDVKHYHLSDAEQQALAIFYSKLGTVPRRSIYQWARLQIPGGQVA